MKGSIDSADIVYVKEIIEDILIPYTESFAWKDFGDKGSACYAPMSFSSLAEKSEFDYLLGVTYSAMAYGSSIHHALGRNVAKVLEARFITYWWLAKAVTRVVSGATYNELLRAAKISALLRRKLKQKGLENESCSI